MNHRTASNQRKVRVSNTNRPKKVKPKSPVQIKAVQVEEDESCQIRGCGCGN
ncbi:MAG: hypothetical protein GWP21_00240 [Euryarchaeota archaeon]|jgi:phosphotransferase system HPr-like phosphotransfer protein|nr:hypothetical protein [Euryarchaeota archaeon]MBT7244674.1 hypothetical protein [Euryarchaeota archaeon]NCF96327.1 hypothetical protein [Euryarchaeota archaeon]